MKASVGIAAVLIAAAGGADARDTAPPPKTMQWTYGSSEAAALDRMTFRMLVLYVAEQQARRRLGLSVDSAVLAEGASLDAPQWRECGSDMGSAVIFDIDETTLLNTGWNRDTARRGDPAFDPARWLEWERSGATSVEPVPGALEAVKALRADGVTVIFVSNRDAVDKDGTSLVERTQAALAGAGFGDVVPGDTLLLKDAAKPTSDKDPRRTQVAATRCVLAMAGDQFGDFSDRLNPRSPNSKMPDVRARRALATSVAVTQRLGRGWFLLANPMYGPGVAGGYDELFGAVADWPERKDGR